VRREDVLHRVDGLGEHPNHVWPVYPTPEAARAQTEIAALVTG
jgi:hypothetical protein